MGRSKVLTSALPAVKPVQHQIAVYDRGWVDKNVKFQLLGMYW
jgi:hypothetical protein